jgi:ankyrin repeat protein
MRKVLQTLPKDLNETYDRIIQNIPQTRIHNAIKLLQLLIHSERPMLLKEVVDAVATDPDDDWPFTFDNRVDPVDAIMGYCPSFLRITTTYAKKEHPKYRSHFLDDSEEDEEDKKDERLADSNIEVRLTIQLAHFSVQEYLLLDRKENPYHEYFAGQPANATITRICLAYLWAAAKASRLHPSVSKFPLASYAAEYWPKHASIAGDSEEATFTWIRKLLTDNKLSRVWWTLYVYDAFDYVPLELTLYCVSQYGLSRSVKHLLEAGANVNCNGHKPLRAACKFGSTETVRLLIEHGADPNPRDFAEDILKVAARTGNAEIILLLLENGAQVNAADVGSMSVLHCACQSGHVGAVQVLLDHGADIDAQDSSWGTAICVASHRGHKEITHLLLDRGANIYIHGGRHGNALQAACDPECGHIDRETVVRLLDEGADPNAMGGEYGTVLCAASRFGNIELVEILLQRGANVNAAGWRRGGALYLAAHYGHVKILRVLLDNGADPNAFGDHYGTALSAASRFGEIEVVELLLRKGADVNATGGKYGCALCAAACFGHVEVLRKLLDIGAISNTQGRPYRYALEDALLKGCVDTAEILFEKQAKRQLAITNANHSARLKVRLVCIA